MTWKVRLRQNDGHWGESNTSRKECYESGYEDTEESARKGEQDSPPAAAQLCFYIGRVCGGSVIVCLPVGRSAADDIFAVRTAK
jgi:hypothetical protein